MGAGDEGGAEAAPSPIHVTRSRRCIGDPPRQIEDPQSPPCVPYWEGDNGGATTRGVTRNEIRLAAPNWDAFKYPALEAFFNRRFEFYGRSLHLLETPSEQCTVAGGHAGDVHRVRSEHTKLDQRPRRRGAERQDGEQRQRRVSEEAPGSRRAGLVERPHRSSPSRASGSGR